MKLRQALARKQLFVILCFALLAGLSFQNCSSSNLNTGSHINLQESGNGGGYAGITSGTYMRVSEVNRTEVTGQIVVTSGSAQYQDFVTPSNSRALSASDLGAFVGDGSLALFSGGLYQMATVSGPSLPSLALVSALQVSCVNTQNPNGVPITKIYVAADGTITADIFVTNTQPVVTLPNFGPVTPSIVPIPSGQVTRSDTATARTYAGSLFNLTIDLTKLTNGITPTAPSTVQYTENGQAMSSALTCALDSGS